MTQLLVECSARPPRSARQRGNAAALCQPSHGVSVPWLPRAPSSATRAEPLARPGLTLRWVLHAPPWVVVHVSSCILLTEILQMNELVLGGHFLFYQSSRLSEDSRLSRGSRLDLQAVGATLPLTVTPVVPPVCLSIRPSVCLHVATTDLQAAHVSFFVPVRLR